MVDRRAAARRRADAETDLRGQHRRAIAEPARSQPRDHDHPGGRGACTHGCPAWQDPDVPRWDA